MSKENILKEFEERFTFTSDDLSEDETKILGTIKCFHQETSPNEVKQFISKAIDQTKEETMMIIKKDLIKIADAGEYEDLRREVEYYFK